LSIVEVIDWGSWKTRVARSLRDKSERSTNKYADFINTTGDILIEDPKFAKIYLRESRTALA
jgi:hypothetical protein